MAQNATDDKTNCCYDLKYILDDAIFFKQHSFIPNDKKKEIYDWFHLPFINNKEILIGKIKEFPLITYDNVVITSIIETKEEFEELINIQNQIKEKITENYLFNFLIPFKEENKEIFNEEKWLSLCKIVFNEKLDGLWENHETKAMVLTKEKYMNDICHNQMVFNCQTKSLNNIYHFENEEFDIFLLNDLFNKETQQYNSFKNYSFKDIIKENVTLAYNAYEDNPEEFDFQFFSSAKYTISIYDKDEVNALERFLVYDKKLNKLAGSCLLHYNKELKRGYLYDVCVRKEFRRRGIATKVLEFAFYRAFHTLQMKTITLTAMEDAVGIYERFGFTTGGIIHYCVKDPIKKLKE
ncbi:hypothetical protein ABK040_003738 [Willaertia magna]